MTQQSTAYAESVVFLLSQVGAHTAQRFGHAIDRFGVDARSYGVLSNLTAMGPLTQQQLADALGIHRNNMVGLVDAMEDAGWLTRVKSRSDRRSVTLQMTRSGRALVSRVDALMPNLRHELLGALDPDEEHQLLGLLSRVASSQGLRPGVHPHLSARPRRASRPR